MVPFVVSSGRLPRNVIIDRTSKLYKSFNIESLLDEVGIEWRDPKAAPGSWLPLEGFDNSDFESRLPEEWLELIQKSEGKPLKGKALCKDPTQGGLYV